MQLVQVSRTPPAPHPAALGALAAAVAVLGGLVLGIGTQELQGVLPGSWGVLANSGVAWALGAFAVGAVMPSPRAAALGGAVAMVLATISYYQAVEWSEGISSDGRGALIWSLAGLVAGPAFGVAGHWVRRRPDLRWPALAPVAGILLAEGAHLLWFVGVEDLWPAGVVEIVAGATLTALGVLRAQRPLVVLGVVAGAVVIHRLAQAAIGAGFGLA